MTPLVHIAAYCLLISAYLYLTLAINPRFLIMEGTTKADYGDKGYHVRAGLKGLAVCAIGSAAIGSLIFAVKIIIAAIAR